MNVFEGVPRLDGLIRNVHANHMGFGENVETDRDELKDIFEVQG